jgi:crossover junction endodeoxyribonuclease RuvC
MMNFLGLDLSLTATGFYLIKEGGKDEYFEINTKPEDFDNDIERADYIASKIVDSIKNENITFIAMEDYFTGKQPQSVIKLATLGTVVRMRLLDAGYSYMTFAVSQIKKFETGKGVAPKDNMLKSVYKRHNLDTASNNIADACAIAHVGRAYYEWQAGRRDFLKYETEVLKKVEEDREQVKPYKIDLDSKKVTTKKK